jgi:cytosine/adenosine deaminase-related metal-dependent hydrolase
MTERTRDGGTVVECRYLIRSAADVVEDAALAYADGVVIDSGSADDVLQRHPGFARLGSRTDTVVMPGLINSHHHGFGLSTLQYGVDDDYLESWLIDLISLPPVDPYLDTMWSAMRQIRSGVTAVQHSSFVRSPVNFRDEIDASFRAYADIGMRALLAVQARDRNSYVYQDDDAFLATVPEQLANRVTAAAAKLPWPEWPEVKGLILDYSRQLEDHPTLGVEICAEGPEWCSEDLLVQVAETARRHDLRIHMHCLESSFQPSYLRREYGMRAVNKLQELGILGPHVSLAHAAWMTEEELQICATNGVVLCHCPSSNLRLRNGVFPLGAARDNGVTVGIGLDSNTINDDDDMLQELRLALRVHRLPSPPQLSWAPTPTDIFQMATAYGAAAMGKAGVIGELSRGKAADLVLVDYRQVEYPYAVPGTGIVDQLVTRAKSTAVTDVVINGVTVMSDRKFTRIDEDAIASALIASARRPMPDEHREWRGAMVDLRPYVDAFYDAWDVDGVLKPTYVPNSLH